MCFPHLFESLSIQAVEVRDTLRRINLSNTRLQQKLISHFGPDLLEDIPSGHFQKKNSVNLILN